MTIRLLINVYSAIFLGATGTQAADIAAGETYFKTHEVIPCAQEKDEALGECTFRVKRDKKGKVSLTAIFANGFKRELFFKDDKFLKANTTMSGTGTDTDWSLEDNLHKIRVDDQRYDVPVALVSSPDNQ